MKFGFIGGGNMGGAIIGGVIKSGAADLTDIIVSDKSERALDEFAAAGIETTSDNKYAAKSADVLFLSVKPQFVYDVIDEIKDSVGKDTVIVSIVAGQSIKAISEAFGREIKLVRVMPNTPALVGEGMAALTPNENVTDAEADSVLSVFKGLGRGEIVPESLMDAVTAVSGSSPAYVFMIIEAMADAAVMGGMPRTQAYTFAAQAVMGSAKMVLETGKHPAELKDSVCSPAGTTIDAVASLEKDGLRSSIINAMTACMEKSKELGKK